MTGGNFELFFLEMTQGQKKKGDGVGDRVWEGDAPGFSAASSVILCQAGGLAPRASLLPLLSRNRYVRERG